MKQILVLAGAGLSASAGLSPFRNETGKWNVGEDLQTALQIGHYMTRPKARKTVWDWIHDADIENKQPTAAHLALKKLSDAGGLIGILTQNIDGLELKAGIPESKVWQIHGYLKTTYCQRCFYASDTRSIIELLYSDGSKYDMEDWSYETSGKTIPEIDDKILHCCEWNHKKNKKCNGVLKPGIVFYGEDVRKDAWTAATSAIYYADELWVLGTSLNVHPAAELPKMAASWGKTVRIVSLGDVDSENVPRDAIMYREPVDDAVNKLVEDAMVDV